MLKFIADNTIFVRESARCLSIFAAHTECLCIGCCYSSCVRVGRVLEAHTFCHRRGFSSFLTLPPSPSSANFIVKSILRRVETRTMSSSSNGSGSSDWAAVGCTFLARRAVVPPAHGRGAEFILLRRQCICRVTLCRCRRRRQQQRPVRIYRWCIPKVSPTPVI